LAISTFENMRRPLYRAVGIGERTQLTRRRAPSQ
jgi:hypothetical protein